MCTACIQLYRKTGLYSLLKIMVTQFFKNKTETRKQAKDKHGEKYFRTVNGSVLSKRTVYK